VGENDMFFFNHFRCGRGVAKACADAVLNIFNQQKSPIGE